ncbi:AraC family transcriptional regulator [Levilactobacillus fujinensis]|uniref:AraC family transcriptional regulator n=1 Tax=Levilactobacillus fujinensis TaxID=2486024 RepID=A0ABW1TJB8_9LACO|nr:AraC family transcriptional regulator [Levilactobacillus fujinensis]
MDTASQLQLDKKVRQIVPAERIYDLTDYYAKLPSKVVAGRKIYIFDNLISVNSNFKISKHDRFLPVPTHVHTFIELNFVYAGTCSQIIDGTHITLHSGELCIIDTDVPHSISKTGKDDIIFNVLIRKEYFTANFFENLSGNGVIFDFLVNVISYRQQHDQYIVFHSNPQSHMYQTFLQILWETYFPSLCSHQMIDNYLKVLFIDLVRIYEYDSNQAIKGDDSVHTILAVMRYMEQHFDHCTLKSAAQKFNYTPNYLSTLIKRNTHTNFSDLLQTMRLQNVCFLLENSTDPINQIATQSGFSNQTFFYKKFQAAFNMSPADYRHSQQVKI